MTENFQSLFFNFFSNFNISIAPSIPNFKDFSMADLGIGSFSFMIPSSTSFFVMNSFILEYFLH